MTALPSTRKPSQECCVLFWVLNEPQERYRPTGGCWDCMTSYKKMTETECILDFRDI